MRRPTNKKITLSGPNLSSLLLFPNSGWILKMVTIWMRKRMPALMAEMMLSTWTRKEFQRYDHISGHGDGFPKENHIITLEYKTHHSSYNHTSGHGDGFPIANHTVTLEYKNLTIVATTMHLVLVMDPAIANPPERNQATEAPMAKLGWEYSD